MGGGCELGAAAEPVYPAPFTHHPDTGQCHGLLWPGSLVLPTITQENLGSTCSPQTRAGRELGRVAKRLEIAVTCPGELLSPGASQETALRHMQ